jgi:ubiquitin carboxyl-terminal hydrolase 9/13
MKIKKSPKILALHLKRFKYTEDMQRNLKLFHRVVYPPTLRLFNTTDDADDPERMYELYAVVVHIGGGPYHGHYVTIVKNDVTGKWMLIDDEAVEAVDDVFIGRFYGDRPGMASAYVLFYQQVQQKPFEPDDLIPVPISNGKPPTSSVSSLTNGLEKANGNGVGSRHNNDLSRVRSLSVASGVVNRASLTTVEEQSVPQSTPPISPALIPTLAPPVEKPPLERALTKKEIKDAAKREKEERKEREKREKELAKQKEKDDGKKIGFGGIKRWGGKDKEKN